MRLRLPQLGCAVYEVQPAKKTERESRPQRLRQCHQASNEGVVSRGLPAQELAVQRLVAGTADGETHQTDSARVSAKLRLTSCQPPLAQCSKSCGRGSRSRESYCMNNLGRRLADRECSEHQRVVTESCSDQPCPKWSFSEWSEVGPCVTATVGKLAGARHLMTFFYPLLLPPPPSPVPGDLWEGCQAQTSVLHNEHRRKAQRALLRLFLQTSHCGNL